MFSLMLYLSLFSVKKQINSCWRERTDICTYIAQALELEGAKRKDPKAFPNKSSIILSVYIYANWKRELNQIDWPSQKVSS